MRLVLPSDADAILLLRRDPELSRFLSPVSPDSNAQIEWIQQYKSRESLAREFYFAILDCQDMFLGTTRIYNIDYRAKTFTVGSWILKRGCNALTVLESILATYSFAFDGLALELDIIEVRNGNAPVLAFHRQMGATRVCQTDENTYFVRTRSLYMAYLEKMVRIVQIKRFDSRSLLDFFAQEGIRMVDDETR